LNNETSATQVYRLRFKHLAETIEPNEGLLLEEIDNDLPWTFVQKNGQWQLEGVASICTRAKQVRVLYPDNLSCRSDAEVLDIADIAPKKLIETSGRIQLTDSENSFVIKTAQQQATERYYLLGNILCFDSKPRQLYLGLPRLICVNDGTETGTRTEIPAIRLTARPANSKAAWTRLTAQMHGVYDIRLLDAEANIQFRKKCVLLPENFTIRLKPVNSLEGHVYLENTGDAIISFPPDIGCTSEKPDNTCQSASKSIQITASNNVQKKVKLFRF
jgi:hypothetical protein